jgi:hypothetical protein
MPTNVNLSIPTYALADVAQLTTYAAQLAAINYHIANMEEVRAKILAASMSTALPTVPYTGPTDAAIDTDWAAAIAKKTDVNGAEFDPTIGTII